MKHPFLPVLGLLLLAVPVFAGNDTITLESGKVYHGNILYWTSAQFVMAVDGKEEPERLNVAEIQTIQFGSKRPIKVDAAAGAPQIKVREEAL